MHEIVRVKFVVENDTFLRLIQVVLDPTAPQERIEAFAHFCLHDLADFRAWCDKLRAQAANLFPADVRLVDSQDELLTHLPNATVAVVEELSFGAQEVAAAGNNLRFVQKYGFTTRNIDQAACDRRRRKRVNHPPPGEHLDRGTRLDAHARAGAPSDAERQPD